jgi:hypothetical protein
LLEDSEVAASDKKESEDIIDKASTEQSNSKVSTSEIAGNKDDQDDRLRDSENDEIEEVKLADKTLPCVDSDASVQPTEIQTESSCEEEEVSTINTLMAVHGSDGEYTQDDDTEVEKKEVEEVGMVSKLNDDDSISNMANPYESAVDQRSMNDDSENNTIESSTSSTPMKTPASPPKHKKGRTARWWARSRKRHGGGYGTVGGGAYIPQVGDQVVYYQQAHEEAEFKFYDEEYLSKKSSGDETSPSSTAAASVSQVQDGKKKLGRPRKSETQDDQDKSKEKKKKDEEDAKKARRKRREELGGYGYPRWFGKEGTPHAVDCTVTAVRVNYPADWPQKLYDRMDAVLACGNIFCSSTLIIQYINI